MHGPHYDGSGFVGAMADVFISYSSEDRERVRPLADALEKNGFSVWWDHVLVAGDDYSTVIKQELGQARAVVVVWTLASVDSPWVRDEGARARDAGRLVPVMLDAVDIPLGFGSINAEDFTTWNGNARAPQVSLLIETLRARIEGRPVSAAALKAKRRRLKRRMRVVSWLTGAAAIIVIVGAAYMLLNPHRSPPPPQAALDPTAQLLALVNSGKITGDQAVALAQALQKQAFADAPASEVYDEPLAEGLEAEPEPGPANDAPASPGVKAEPKTMAKKAASISSDSVSGAEAVESAKSSYADAVAELLRDPNPQIRAAVVEASSPATREAGLGKMRTLAEQKGPSTGALWRAIGALNMGVGDQAAAESALENARSVNPQDKRVWRMLSFAYNRKGRGAEKGGGRSADEARGAALVGDGLAAAAAGRSADAEKAYREALTTLERPRTRAFVFAKLGDSAAARSDWKTAEEAYAQAVDMHAAASDSDPKPVEESKLGRAYAKQSWMWRACETLQAVHRRRGVAISDTSAKEKCDALTGASDEGKTSATPPTAAPPATTSTAPTQKQKAEMPNTQPSETPPPAETAPSP